MHDQQAEREFAAQWFDRMMGHVLMAGLGIGLHAKYVAANPRVRLITVLEACPDVVSLYAQSPYRIEGMEIRVGDYFRWDPPQMYDSLWVDIHPRPPSSEELRHVLVRASSFTTGPVVIWPVGGQRSQGESVS